MFLWLSTLGIDHRLKETECTLFSGGKRRHRVCYGESYFEDQLQNVQLQGSYIDEAVVVIGIIQLRMVFRYSHLRQLTAWQRHQYLYWTRIQ